MDVNRERIHSAAEIMEWMRESPSHAVHQYLRNKGYSEAEIQEASRYFVLEK